MHANLTFDYIRADTLEDALAALGEHGNEARIIAGGTELLTNMKQRAVMPKVLIDIESIPELKGITEEADAIAIGARTPLREIERSIKVKEGAALLAEAIGSIATMQIRNLGTIGGNICQTVKCPFFNQSHINLFMREAIEPCRQKGGKVCHAAGIDSLTHSVLGKPVNGCVATTASDLAAPLTALHALVGVAGPAGQSRIPVEDFIVGGGRTALKDNEILTHVIVPPMEEGTRGRYLKYAHSTRNFPILSLAAILRGTNDGDKDASLVIGGITPTPLRLAAVEHTIRDGKTAPKDIGDAFRKDVKGAREKGEESAYKLKRARIMVQDVVQGLFEIE